MSILVFLKNTKILHHGEVVLPGDLVLVVLLGDLAQVALEAGPGEAGGGTAQERQEGTVLDLLDTNATPEAAGVEEEEVDAEATTTLDVEEAAEDDKVEEEVEGDDVDVGGDLVVAPLPCQSGAILSREHHWPQDEGVEEDGGEVDGGEAVEGAEGLADDLEDVCFDCLQHQKWF